MSIKQRCAQLTELKTNLDLLLRNVHNCAMHLSEYPSCEGRLETFLSTFNIKLTTMSQGLVSSAQVLADLTDRVAAEQLTLGSTPANSHSDSELHSPQADLVSQAE